MVSSVIATKLKLWQSQYARGKVSYVKRHMFALLFILALALPVIAANPVASAPKRAHEGTVSGGIYSNDFFGFSIEVPSGWKVGDNEVYRKLNERLVIGK